MIGVQSDGNLGQTAVENPQKIDIKPPPETITLWAQAQLKETGLIIPEPDSALSWVCLARVAASRVIEHGQIKGYGKEKVLLPSFSLATGSHVLSFDVDLQYVAAGILQIAAPALVDSCNVISLTDILRATACLSQDKSIYLHNAITRVRINIPGCSRSNIAAAKCARISHRNNRAHAFSAASPSKPLPAGAVLADAAN